MISAILGFTAAWLMFAKPLPKARSTLVKLTPKQSGLLVALLLLLFFPSIAGLIMAASSVLLLPKVIKALPTRNQQREQRLVQQELDLAIDLLATTLGAGLSVLSSLDAVSKVVQPKLAAELTAAANRIQWGSDIEQAFTAELKSIGAALARAMDHGVAAGTALAEIAARARSERKQQLLRKSKKLSVTLALPVALFMLPGFILVGVVPMIVPALSSLW